MEAGPRDGDSADLDGEQECDRGEHAGPAHLHRDTVNQGDLLPRFELVGERPPRVMGGRPHLRPCPKIVHLDDDPVDLVVEGVPILHIARVVLEDLLHAAGRLHPVREAKPPLLQRSEHAAVRLEGGAPMSSTS